MEGENVERLFNQDFHKLRSECLKEGSLFVDPEFGLTKSLAGIDDADEIEWKRPNEISKNPQLITDGISRFDVKQGATRTCYFLASAASLTLNPELFYQVVPQDQSFGEDYAGIFHFRFWRFGKWVDVVVDDKIAVKDNKVIFTKSQDENEFWINLLEKAYAKFHGGTYNGIFGGLPRAALVELTGGVAEHYNLLTTKAANAIFPRILRAYRTGSIMSGGLFITKDIQCGVYAPHAYSITGAAVVEYKKDGKKLQGKLVRIRNPYGDKKEWLGRWSDKSKIWDSVSPVVKEQLALACKDDGEFWMSFKKLLKHFDIFNICHIPGLKGDNNWKWECSSVVGEWVAGKTLGGRIYDRDYHKNPKIFFLLSSNGGIKTKLCDNVAGNEGRKWMFSGNKLTEKLGGNSESYNDEEEEEETTNDEDDTDNPVQEGESLSVLIELMKNTQKRLGGMSPIGFNLYKMPGLETLPENLGCELLGSRPFSNVESGMGAPFTREISGLYNLKPGCYCIVPYNFLSPKFASSSLIFLDSTGLEDIFQEFNELHKVGGQFMVRIMVEVVA